MCGIGGAVSADRGRGRAIAEHVNDRQHHRGPDNAVVVPLGPFTLGNTRLAIQDPTPAGNQPFRSADGRYVCVFNGEIYNFVELIKRYRLDLPNHCDGAVIPELWRQLGPDSLRELRGMFAIALVDTEAQTLVLARDPFGIKPLYHRRLGDGSLAFASEVRSLASLDQRPTLEQSALSRFLQLGALASDQSPFVGIEALPPNSVLTLRADGASESTSLLPGPRPLLEAGRERDLGVVFSESVDIHLRSDVPTVLLLSSGVDSAAVASAARCLDRELHCMTVRGLGGESDESQGARTTSDHYGHSHEVVEAEIDDRSVSEFFAAMQRPSIDGLNTFVVCRAVRDAGYRVALSGLGGDEALGGYAQFRALPLLPALELCDRAPALGRLLAALARRGKVGGNADKVAQLLMAGGPRSALGLDLLQREVTAPDLVAAMTGSPVKAPIADAGTRDFASLVQAELENYMQATLLPDADAFSMCSSVELRVPFVDREVFAAASRLNAGRRRTPGKRLLAQTLNDSFLLALARKRKLGFSVPMADWLSTGPLRPLLTAVRDPQAPVWKHLDRAAAEPILSSSVSERWSSQWSLAALNAWLRSLDGEPGH